MTTPEKITLAPLLGAVAPETQALVIHHMGADCYEAVASGTVQELRASQCVEVCGGRAIEKITLDVDVWPDTPAPVLIITIGGRATEK